MMRPLSRTEFDDQGVKVKPTEPNTTPNATTGILATLRALLGVNGTCAPTCLSSQREGALQAKAVSTEETGAPSTAPRALAELPEKPDEQVSASALEGRRGASRSPVPFRVRTQALRCAGRNGDASRRRVSSLLRYMKSRGQRYAPLLVVLGALAAPCAANAAEPWFHLQSSTRPSFLEPEGEGQLVATVANLGDASASGQVTVTDTLPAGLSAKRIEAEALEGEGGEGLKAVACSRHPLVERPLVCTFTGLAPYESLEIRIAVVVDPGAEQCNQNSSSCEQNQLSVSAPGVTGSSISRPVTISSQPVPFGVEAYEVTPEEEGGAPTTQAGAHPFQVTGTLTMNQAAATRKGGGKFEVHPVALPKDLAGLLPPGLIGNPTPFARCSVTQLDNTECPAQSVIGVVTVTVNEPAIFEGLTTFTTPIANMEPARGEAARFGFFAASIPVFLDAKVRSGGDYGVTLSSSDIPQTAAFLSYQLTFWGVPGRPLTTTPAARDA